MNNNEVTRLPFPTMKSLDSGSKENKASKSNTAETYDQSCRKN